jgi:hypothetical protein
VKRSGAIDSVGRAQRRRGSSGGRDFIRSVISIFRFFLS